MNKKNILWIPGLGADKRMFFPILENLSDMKFNHNFIEYLETESNIDSLETYSLEILSKKYKKFLNKKYNLVIGCSMGGMILQILWDHKLIKSKKILLISTAFHAEDLSLLSKISIFLLKIIPVFLRRKVQTIIAYSYRIFRFNIKQSREFSKMFYSYPTNLFFEAPLWIKRWKGINNKSRLFSKDIVLIHGLNDPLLSYHRITKTRKPDFSFTGSHILFITHSREIAKLIKTLVLN